MFCLNCSSGIYQPDQKTTSGILPPWALLQKLLSPLLAHPGLFPADPHQSEACLASSLAVSPTPAMQADCVAWITQHPSQGPRVPGVRQRHVRFGGQSLGSHQPPGPSSQLSHPNRGGQRSKLEHMGFTFPLTKTLSLTKPWPGSRPGFERGLPRLSLQSSVLARILLSQFRENPTRRALGQGHWIAGRADISTGRSH